MMHWLNMGGYSLYVWSAYAVAVSVFALNFLSLKRQGKSTQKKLQQWFKRQEV